MNGIKGLALGLGVVTLIVVGLACGAREAPAPKETGSPPESTQAQDRPGPSGSPGERTSPVIPGGAPLVSLTYEGAVYYQHRLSTDEAANLKEDDLELVGVTTESNLLAQGGGDSLDIYKLKNDEDGYVYTLEPEHEQSVQDEGEDGHTITITTTTIEAHWVRWTAADSNQTAPVSSGMMVPRSTTAEELVARADIIAVGTIMSVLGERLMGPYGEDGQPFPEGEDGLPYTDYDVRVEGVLKGDQRVEALVLRMFGHLNNPNAIITPNVFTLPNPGDHLLFALGRNPDGTYGSGPEGLLNIDGEKVSYADGVPFAAEISPDQLTREIKDAAAGESSTTRDTSSFFENASGNTVAPQAQNEPDTEPDVVRQDESAVLAPDIALTAKQTGLPVESVERAIAFQQAFAKYVGELIVRFPDQISAVWTEPIPNTRGHVRFTGEVPPEVTSEIERRGLLDANNVVLTGGGMISMADHSRRADLAHEALADLGYRNFMTFFDPIDYVISVEFLLPEGASHPSKIDLVAAVQKRVGAERDQSGEARFQGRAATVDALDLELTVITGSDPIVTLE